MKAYPSCISFFFLYCYLNSVNYNAYLRCRRIGDRIGIAPTEERAKGYGEEFIIVGIDDKGSLLLDKPLQHDHAATFIPPPPHGNVPALMSAEVVNLSRNIVITGDDFKHVSCDPNLPESVAGEETSVLGCRCSSFRSQCTIGLHTAAMEGGSARIQNTRVERCGQRGKMTCVMIACSLERDWRVLLLSYHYCTLRLTF